MLSGLSRTGRVEYRVASANARARVQAWIRHLALNAFAPKGVERTSRCIAQGTMLTFKPVANSKALLAKLLELYWEGMHRPLRFFLRTSCKYIEAGEITWAVRQVWEGNGRDNRGERDDAYYHLAFRGIDPLDDEFVATTRTVLMPMRDAIDEKAFP